MITRLLKLTISAMLFGFDWVHGLIKRCLGKIDSGKCVVLYYHAVAEEQRKHFARQMEDIVRWRKPIQASSNEALKEGVHHVAITFDDGLRSVIRNALPELTKRKIPVTLFIPAGYIGKEPKWRKSPGNDLYSDTVMSAEEIKKVSNELVSIGSHSMTHCDLTTLEPEGLKKELADSKGVLEEILGHDVTLLSFPHGKYNQNVLEMAQEVGYTRTFTIDPKRAFSNAERFVVGRVKVEPTDWGLEFKLKLFGAYRWHQLVFGLKHRLLSQNRKSRDLSAASIMS